MRRDSKRGLNFGSDFEDSTIIRLFVGYSCFDRTSSAQRGKYTQNYGHVGWKQARWPHLFIVGFEFLIYGWHLCEVWKKSWEYILFKRITIKHCEIVKYTNWMKLNSSHNDKIFLPQAMSFRLPGFWTFVVIFLYFNKMELSTIVFWLLVCLFINVFITFS